MSAVELQAVAKTYADGTRALEGIDLQLADGELLVLLGPSGCGKSTLLHLLAGLDSPSSGRILFDHRDVTTAGPRERNSALVFQDYALYPHMTVRRNLEFPLRMDGLERDERGRRVEEIARLLSIDGLLDRKPPALSGGQKQRVAMGRALVRRPRLFLLDEPLSNLDATLRAQLRQEIRALQQRTATTTVYVTHDQAEAMALADRVAVLRDGRLEQLATPRALYADPATGFVAAFTGSPGMNQFPAELRPDANGARLVAGALEAAVPAPPAHAAGTVIAGLRPESLRIADPDPARVRLAVQLETLEDLGHETLLHCRCRLAGPAEEPTPLIARIPGQPSLSPGSRLELSFDPHDLRLFDADSGRRIGGGDHGEDRGSDDSQRATETGRELR